MTVQFSAIITAVICTHNRESYLKKAIDSLLGQDLNQESYEILVVDNASTDGTAKLVQGYQQKYAAIKYLYEPILGLSQARNSGWKNANGRYVAYLDDDAVAASNWLREIVRAFESDPNLGGVGGKVLPKWEAPRPAWLADSILYYLSVLDLSDKPVPIQGPQWLCGANCAYLKSVLDTVGGFDTALGRIGVNLMSMEETLLQQQVIRAGYGIVYCPSIEVTHTIQAERVTQSWFKKRVFAQGKSEALASSDLLKKLLRLSRIALSFCLKPKRIIALFLTTEDPDLFTQKCIALSMLGYVYGSVKRPGPGNVALPHGLGRRRRDVLNQ